MLRDKNVEYLFSSDLQIETTCCVICGNSLQNKIAEGWDYLHATSSQVYFFVKCEQCNHIYLNPRPQIGEIAKLYPSSYSTYDPKNAKRNSIFSFVKDFVLNNRLKLVLAKIPDDGVILDIGCGDLSLLKGIRKYSKNAKLVGLDWKFGPGLERSAHEFGIETITGTIETVELPNSHFDVILMNQLIEHVWDIDGVLLKCKTILKPGGVLSIETPNANGWDRKFFRGGAWGGYYWPRHLNIFSTSGLVTIVKRADFEVVAHYRLLAPPIWIYSFQFLLTAKGYRKLSQSLFSDKSILWLGVFTIVESVAKLFGFTTSNQKIIARKPKN